MKVFRLILEVSVNPDLTEKEMFRRFEEFIDAIPKPINQILFKSDCCLVNIITEPLPRGEDESSTQEQNK